MKRIFRNLASVLSCLLTALTLANAAPMREARVTQIVSDVKLLPGQAAPRPAVVNDRVHSGTAVRTGTQSRSELTFTDQTITRLGANTIFSFKGDGEPAPPAEGPENFSFEAPSHLNRNATVGSRVMNLVEGAMLFQVPKGTGGATIRTAPVTAAITGTTGIGEYHAPSADHPMPIIKWFCLEGHIILKLNDGSGETVELTAGQMVVSDGTSLPSPMFFDIATMVRTSPFFDPPPASWDLIQAEMQRQLDERIAGQFLDTIAFAALDTSKIVSEIDQGMAAQLAGSTSPATPTPTPTTPTPTPTPSTPTPTPAPDKFGSLTVIASSDPFVIDSSTVLNTDPTITKAVRTDFGKIYRTSGDDGSRAEWMFGSTSAFDSSSGFDHGVDAHFLDNIAAFKFQSLVLDSDPTIQTTGGVTNLALIGVDGITTNHSSATFSFSGIDTLLLATENGSIDLLSGYTFDGPSRMYVYARGASSHLTVDSNISTANDLRLYSEGTVSIAGTLETQNFSSISGGNFTNTNGMVTANGMAVASQEGDITINTGAFHAGSSSISLSLSAGNAVNITMGSDLSMFESASSISVSGNEINLSAGDLVTLNLNVTSPAKFTAGAAGIAASNISFITTGGLELRSGGDIDIYGANIPIANRTISGLINAGGNFHAVSDVTTGDLTAGGNITVDGGNVLVANVTAGETIEVVGNITASKAVTAGGDLTANSITAGTTIDVAGDISSPGAVIAGGDITAFGTLVPTISSPNGILRVGDDGILPFLGSDQGAALQHTITVDSIVSSGGIFFSGNLFGGTGGLSNGGLLTINARTILFDDGSNGIGFVDLDGADVGGFNGADPGAAGNGGTFVVRTRGNITGTSDAVIIARTGLTPPDLPFGGVGGTVAFDADGMVSFDGFIRVSQNTSFESHGAPQRRSETGGNITFHSRLTSGLAIELLENSALESLLLDDAPGVGGTIDITSRGGSINANGSIEADRGTIAISNIFGPVTPSGLASHISLNGSTLVSNVLSISSAGVLEIGLINPVTLSALTMSLHAEGDINTAGIATIGAPRDTSGDVIVNALGAITFSDDIDVERINGGISDGLNLSLKAGDGITGSGTIRLVIDNNSGGNLATGANLTIDAGPTLVASGLNLLVNNAAGNISTGGTIAVTTGALTAGSVDLVINNQAGAIASGGTIDVNVSGSATVTNNANLEVLGSDAATGAGINVNGGDYNVGGTFRAFTDGDGTIAFNNANAHADVLKAGALGANGVLNVGGGTLSADTTLKLYASGSNGQLNFISDVTLGGNSAKILAANAVTIVDGVMVTIGGSNPADVFTNNANYSGFGGNESTTGTFGGAGANDPQSLDSAPAFDDSARPAPYTGPAASSVHQPTHSTSGDDSDWRINSIRKPTGILKVRDSGELVSLLNPIAPDHRKSLTVPNSNGTDTPRNSGRTNPAGRATEARRVLNNPIEAIQTKRLP